MSEYRFQNKSPMPITVTIFWVCIHISPWNISWPVKFYSFHLVTSWKYSPISVALFFSLGTEKWCYIKLTLPHWWQCMILWGEIRCGSSYLYSSLEWFLQSSHSSRTEVSPPWYSRSIDWGQHQLWTHWNVKRYISPQFITMARGRAASRSVDRAWIPLTHESSGLRLATRPQNIYSSWPFIRNYTRHCHQRFFFGLQSASFLQASAFIFRSLVAYN